MAVMVHMDPAPCRTRWQELVKLLQGRAGAVSLITRSTSPILPHWPIIFIYLHIQSCASCLKSFLSTLACLADCFFLFIFSIVFITCPERPEPPRTARNAKRKMPFSWLHAGRQSLPIEISEIQTRITRCIGSICLVSFARARIHGMTRFFTWPQHKSGRPGHARDPAGPMVPWPSLQALLSHFLTWLSPHPALPPSSLVSSTDT